MAVAFQLGLGLVGLYDKALNIREICSTVKKGTDRWKLLKTLCLGSTTLK